MGVETRFLRDWPLVIRYRMMKSPPKPQEVAVRVDDGAVSELDATPEQKKMRRTVVEEKK